MRQDQHNRIRCITFLACVLFWFPSVCTGASTNIKTNSYKGLTDALMTEAASFHSAKELEACKQRLKEMVQEVKRRLDNNGDHRAAIRVLNDYVFAEQRFQYEKSIDNVAFALLPSVISQKRGNCLGLATLYLCLGEQLGLPFFGVASPNHFFLRLDLGQTYQNVETADYGRELKDAEYIERDQIPRALVAQVYLKPLSKEETVAYVRANIGVAYLKNGKFDKATKFLTLATETVPNQPEFLSNLGIAQLQSGNTAVATQLLAKAVKLNPTRAYTHVNLAQAYKDGNKYDLAIAEYRKAIILDPKLYELVKENLVALHYKRGQRFFEQRLYKDALAEWRAYLDIVPDDGDVHNNVAVLFYTLRNYPAAWKHAKSAARCGKPIDHDFLVRLSKAMPEPKD